MTIPVLVHKVILYSTGVVSVLANGLLIVLLLNKTSRALGKYRILLASFALADIFISLFNAWYIPICVMREYGYLIFGEGALALPPQLGLIANMTFSTTFYVPFVLLSLHFTYRLLSLTRPSFLRNRFGLFLGLSVAYSVAYLASILFLCATMIKQGASVRFLEPLLSYSADKSALLNAFPIVYLDDNLHMNTITVVCMIGIGVLSSKSIIISLVCVKKILSSMKLRVMEIRTRRLHMQLFRALLIQFTIPCLLMLLPLSVVLTLPLTGVSLGQLGNVCILLTAFFPAIDPLLVTISISRFRNTILDWFYVITGQKAKRNERREIERSKIIMSKAQNPTDTLENIVPVQTIMKC